MCFRLSRSFASLFLAFVACSAVAPAAHASSVGVYATSTGGAPPTSDLDKYVPVYVDFWVDEGWYFDSWSISDLTNGVDSLDLEMFYRNVQPGTVPIDAVLAVLLHPDSPVGLFHGTFTATAHNPETGEVDTDSSSFDFWVYGQSPSPVPEPTSALLLGLGVLGLAGRFIRRRG